jgi:uncharacterized protein
MPVYSFNRESVPAEDSSPAPDRVVRGAPNGEARNGYASADGNRLAGEWSCSEGAWRVSYSEWEYCYILEGQVRLTGDDGTVIEANAGDNLVIEPGFEGVWENITPVKKLYVIDLAAVAGGER